MYLKDRALYGIEWTAAARVVKQIFQFVISIILARLLTPKDFGLIGMIVVFTGFASLFNEMGFGAALIQRKEIDERHLSSIFWLNIAVGMILACIVLAIAPLISIFYSEPRLKAVAMLISVNFFIGSFNVVQLSILNRLMEFRKLAIIETITIVIAGGFAITLAFIGFGVWSLAWQMIVSTTIGVIVTWRVADWRPQLKFDKRAVKELLGFSSNLLGFNVLNYWVRNIDNLLIGKFIGSVGLGVYSRAYSIMLMPLGQISATLGRVMFPSLSTIQDDKVLTKRIYLKTISAIALITFPMMMGLLTVADSFILALLGPKWKAVIPVLQIFAVLGLVQSIGTTVGWIYSSQGRTDWQFKWSIAAGGLLIVSIVIGIILGTIMSVAICYTIMSGVILAYPSFAIPGKLIDMTFTEVVCSVSGILGCAILMSVSVHILGIALPSEWPHWARLLLLITFGVIVYVVLIHFFKLRAYLEVKQLVREHWGSRFVQCKRT